MNETRNLLDAQCGQTWSLQHCDQDGCPPRNKTCTNESSVWDLVAPAQKLAIFYAHRRERNHLLNVAARCVTTANPEECKKFVDSRLADYSNWLTANTPRITDALFDGFRVASDDLSTRSCDGDLPCVSRLIDPILSAPDEESTTKALLSSKRLLLTPVSSQNVEDALFVRDGAVCSIWF